MSLSRRGARLLLFGSLAMMALMSGGQVLTSDPVPWGWIGTFGVGTFLLVGPVMWALRGCFSEAQRERLGYVVGGIILLCFPVVIGLGLIFGNLLIALNAGVFGGLVGFAVALLAERSVVPERLRSNPQ